MRRSRFEKINLKIVAVVIIFIFFITISIGYSYLRQQLNIYGKSNIVTQGSEDGNIQGYSTYSWQIIDSIKQEDDRYTTFNISLSIVNMDEDISSWVIGFDIPEGYNEALSKIDEASLTSYENGRLTIYAKDENAYIVKGNSIKLEMQLTVMSDSFDINNLTLNGKLASENI